MGYETTLHQELCGCVIEKTEHDFFSQTEECYHSKCAYHRKETDAFRIKATQDKQVFDMICREYENKLLTQLLEIKTLRLDDITGKTITAVRQSVEEQLKELSYIPKIEWFNRKSKCKIIIGCSVLHHYKKNLRIVVEYYFAIIESRDKTYKPRLLETEPKFIYRG